MNRWKIAVLLVGVVIAALGCKNKTRPPKNPSSEKKLRLEFEPSITKVDLTSRIDSKLREGTALLKATIRNTVDDQSQLVSDRTSFTFHRLDKPGQKRFTRPASAPIRLPAGSYRVELLYRVSSLVHTKGFLKRLTVESRRSYLVDITIAYRYDTLSLNLLNFGRKVHAKTTLKVFQVGDLEKQGVQPLLTQRGVVPLALPVGSYDLRYVFQESELLTKTIDRPDLIVRGELRNIEQRVDFEYSFGYLTVKVKNRGTDVTGRCRLRLYDGLLPDPVAIGQRKPRWKGVAGTKLTLPEGDYTLFVKYQEPDAELLKGEKWIKPVKVAGHYRKQQLNVAFDLSWGEVAFTVLDGQRKVDSSTRVFVFHSDKPERALDHELGGRSLKLLKGSYDFKAIYISKTGPDSGSNMKKVLWKRGVSISPEKKVVLSFQFAAPGLPRPQPTTLPKPLPTPKPNLGKDGPTLKSKIPPPGPTPKGPKK